jgi:predicted DNA-binding transcriptional regulator AlpA
MERQHRAPVERKDRYLTTVEVAVWLGLSSTTLGRWRQRGEGPKATWMTAACVRYLRSDVEAWLKDKAA